MLLRLHTADHIRLASPMREPQFPRTALHGTRIMRLAMFQEEDAVAVRCADDRQRVFSALLYPHGASYGECLQAVRVLTSRPGRQPSPA